MNRARVVSYVASIILVGQLFAQVPLPDPAIIASSPPFNAGFGVELVFDDNLDTDYASLGAANDTFIDFDFGEPVLIAQVTFTDRRSSGVPNGTGGGGPADNVTAFDLIFSDDSTFDANDVTISVSSPACCDTVMTPIGGGIVARYVRWDVTASAGGATNLGAGEFDFLAYDASLIPALDPRALGLLGLLLAITGAVLVRRSS